MKTKTLFFVMTIFLLAFTTACGSGAEPAAPPAEAPVEAPVEEPAAPSAEEPAEEAPTEAPAEEPSEEPAESPAVAPEFPLPDDASNVMVVGEGVTNFQTELSIPDVVTFYRFAFPDYTEREVVTVVEESSLNLVFDGHESGKAVVIQGFPMGEGMVNVSIRLE